MKNLIRKIIKEQIENIFEAEVIDKTDTIAQISDDIKKTEQNLANNKDQQKNLTTKIANLRMTAGKPEGQTSEIIGLNKQIKAKELKFNQDQMGVLKNTQKDIEQSLKDKQTSLIDAKRPEPATPEVATPNSTPSTPITP